MADLLENFHDANNHAIVLWEFGDNVTDPGDAAAYQISGFSTPNFLFVVGPYVFQDYSADGDVPETAAYILTGWSGTFETDPDPASDTSGNLKALAHITTVDDQGSGNLKVNFNHPFTDVTEGNGIAYMLENGLLKDGSAVTFVSASNGDSFAIVNVADGVTVGDVVTFTAVDGSRPWGTSYATLDVFSGNVEAAATTDEKDLVPGGGNSLGTWVTVEGGTSSGTSENYSAQTSGGWLIANGSYDIQGMSVRFTVTVGDKIELQGYVASTPDKVALFKDGVLVGITTMSGATNDFAYVTLGTSLSPGTYQIISINGGAASFKPIWLSIRVSSSTGTAAISNTAPAALDLYQGIGNSIMQGNVGGILADWTDDFMYKIGVARGVVAIGHGISGTTVGDPTPGGTLAFTSRPATVSTIHGKRVLVEGGTNDLNQNGGTHTTAMLTTAVTSVLNSILGADATTVIFWLGILPRGDQTWATIQTWNAAIIAGIAACSAPGRVRYVDPAPGNLAGSGYQSGGSFTQSPNFGVDQLHPLAAGHTIIANLFLDAMTAFESVKPTAAIMLLQGMAA